MLSPGSGTVGGEPRFLEAVLIMSLWLFDVRLEDPIRGELQIKTTARYDFTPTRLSSKRQMVTNTGKDVGNLWPSQISGGNIKWCSCFRKQFGSSSKCKAELPEDSAMLFLDTYPRELKTYVCTQNLIHKCS